LAKRLGPPAIFGASDSYAAAALVQDSASIVTIPALGRILYREFTTLLNREEITGPAFNETHWVAGVS
jgi:hypothetical protein